MTGSLVRKLLRDVRLPLVVVVLLLAGFQLLWAKVTEKITGQLAPFFLGLAASQGIPEIAIENILFEGPGKITQTLMGGEKIKFYRAMDMLSISYVHPLVQTIFCIWAIGRSSGAIAGEIDRGTMELLMAQPIARQRVVLAHLCVDFLTIPILCFSLWGGTWLGTWLVGPIKIEHEGLKDRPLPIRPNPEVVRRIESDATQIDPAPFGLGLSYAAALVFAVSGYTMWLSACGRYRWRVLGTAVLLTLLQFLVNLIGQLWDAVEPLRPITVFYYYRPQQIILTGLWSAGIVRDLVVLVCVGAAGYGLALWTFCRRDLPAPL
jgi:ABC-2 type transport system permease protein